MTANEILKYIEENKADGMLETIYGKDDVASQRGRYAKAVREFISLYGDSKSCSVYSVPGRSELSGNHTDHNRGRVIACSVNLDIIAVAAPADGSVINVKSEGFPADSVDFAAYCEPDEKRFGHSDSLIAGVADGMKKRGYKIGGFNAYTTSNVLKGSGLSSSAAFENMVGTILSHIYNSGSADFVTIAQISQYAENRFFGKPCGLMDQIACAAGGAVTIDFRSTEKPEVEKLDFDFNKAGYKLCIVNTGGNHADLTADYAAVPAEMKAVAKALGKEVLRDADEDAFVRLIPELREKLGDRAILRALHYYEENRRVAAQAAALRQGCIEDYFSGVIASGRSSCFYLQNVYSPSNVNEQGLTLALCLCEKFLKDLEKPTAWRLQGGGFAGTIQAYVPTECTAAFSAYMSAVFGEGSVYILRIRPAGAVKVI